MERFGILRNSRVSLSPTAGNKDIHYGQAHSLLTRVIMQLQPRDHSECLVERPCVRFDTTCAQVWIDNVARATRSQSSASNLLCYTRLSQKRRRSVRVGFIGLGKMGRPMVL